uniref:Uncharacterized protein n=1 Tax=Tetranychus urticae TaxID=32264 RepID=T1JTR5_TETUR
MLTFLFNNRLIWLVLDSLLINQGLQDFKLNKLRQNSWITGKSGAIMGIFMLLLQPNLVGYRATHNASHKKYQEFSNLGSSGL